MDEQAHEADVERARAVLRAIAEAPRPSSVSNLGSRYQDETTFDDAMKRVGIDDVDQRAWVVRHLDLALAPSVTVCGHQIVFWAPSSRDHVAIGMKVWARPDGVVPEGHERVGWNRLACAYRTRVSFPYRDDVEGDYDFETVYRWRSVPIPGAPGRGRRAASDTSRPAAVCAGCFMVLPASGACDECA
ncbi:hypothetical protein [Cellulosimicrobium sp. 22601]|uniref:hypothetical protein n=1 Tax=unclassified Cellulosimicrobium TaxID=2624466 RepID=UPI003F826553